MTWTILSECFISAQQSYNMLKFDYDIGSKVPGADFIMAYSQWPRFPAVVVQLVERLLPIPEVRGSNTIIDKNVYWTFTLNCAEKTKNEKLTEKDPLKTEKFHYLSFAVNSMTNKCRRTLWRCTASSSPWPPCSPSSRPPATPQLVTTFTKESGNDCKLLDIVRCTLGACIAEW